jgi:hypothetical protein
LCRKGKAGKEKKSKIEQGKKGKGKRVIGTEGVYTMGL